MKSCASCKRELPLDAFTTDAKGPQGRYPYCRECQRAKSREWYLRNREKAQERARWASTKYRFGIGEAAFKEKSLAQGGKCAICNEECKSGQRLSIDHNHEDGGLRDLLCRNCNAGLGQFNDDPELLRAAQEYLLRWRTRGVTDAGQRG